MTLKEDVQRIQKKHQYDLTGQDEEEEFEMLCSSDYSERIPQEG